MSDPIRFTATDGYTPYAFHIQPAPAARREHPGCGFVRKETAVGRSSVLHTPIGRITCKLDDADVVIKPYLQRTKDVLVLNEFLKNVAYFPPAEAHVYGLGMSPALELRKYWAAGNYDTLAQRDEAPLQSALRKLTRLIVKRAALAKEAGGRLLILEDDLCLADKPLMEVLLAGYADLCAKLPLPFLVTVQQDGMELWAEPEAEAVRRQLKKSLAQAVELRDGGLHVEGEAVARFAAGDAETG